MEGPRGGLNLANNVRGQSRQCSQKNHVRRRPTVFLLGARHPGERSISSRMSAVSPVNAVTKVNAVKKLTSAVGQRSFS